MSLLLQRKFVVSCIKSSSWTQVRHGTSIPVVLLKDVDGRGEEGEIVSVKRGYARNFLVPRKFAAYATKENKSRLVEKTADGSTRLKQAIKLDLSEHLKIVKSEKLVINVVPNYKGVILVTPTDVRNVVESAGVMLDRKAIILLENPITTAGSHKVSIDGNELTIEVVVNDL